MNYFEKLAYAEEIAYELKKEAAGLLRAVRKGLATAGKVGVSPKVKGMSPKVKGMGLVDEKLRLAKRQAAGQKAVALRRQKAKIQRPPAWKPFEEGLTNFFNKQKKR